MMTKAKRITLTPKEKAQKWVDQNGRCGCGCGERLVRGLVQYDHTVAVEDRDPDKPYTRDEEYQFQKALTVACHARKTKAESKERAHIRRLVKERNGQPKRKRTKAKIQSPGWGNLRQKMNGEIVRREE